MDRRAAAAVVDAVVDDGVACALLSDDDDDGEEESVACDDAGADAQDCAVDADNAAVAVEVDGQRAVVAYLPSDVVAVDVAAGAVRGRSAAS